MAFRGKIWVYVIDGSEGLWSNPTDWLNSLFTVRDILVVSVADMVTKVLARIGSNKIKNMFIAGHGAPGYQSIGSGATWESTGTKSLQLNATSGLLVGPAAGSLSSLVGKFTTDAIVTLGGCNVAGRPDGPPMLQAVSRALGGIPVQGGVDTQRPLLVGMEGHVLRCTPTTVTDVGTSWWGSPGSWIN